MAPSYALIADTFPPGRRARALAIYGLGIPIGSAVGVLLGGAIAAAVEWRTTFVVMGVAGLLTAPVFRLLVRDPPRARIGQAPLLPVFGMLAAKPSFSLLSLGGAAGSTAGYGIAFWMPSLMMRSFGLDLAETGRFVGALLLTGGVAGILLGGVIADRWGRRTRRAYALVPAIAYAAGVPLLAAGLLSGSWVAAFALFLVPQALVYAWPGPLLTAVQQLVPAAMRSTASACFLLINNLIGLGLGSWLVGALSKALSPAAGGRGAALCDAGGAWLLPDRGRADGGGGAGAAGRLGRRVATAAAAHPISAEPAQRRRARRRDV